MLPGVWKDCLIDISASATLSEAVDLGRPWDFVEIVFPTITEGRITVQAARTLGGTYQNVYVTDQADGSNSLLQSATTTGDITWIVPIFGLQFLKLLSSVNQLTADKTFRVRGIRK